MVLGDSEASLSQQEEDMVKLLGYCPQENALWPSLTVREHLEMFAAVKGLGKEDAAVSVSRYREKLHSHFTAGGRDAYVRKGDHKQCLEILMHMK